MAFHGPIFTWTNNTIKERLDRYMCNDDWRLLFPKAKVHLSRISSDHCPLLTKLCPQCNLPRTNPPLRLHTIWMQHESYDDSISET